jgi:predicted nucleic acid-binding protein
LTRFVLDASVALAWFLDNPVPPYATRIKQLLLDRGRAVVPRLWHLEMANGIAVAERRRILTVVEGTRCLTLMEELLAQAIETSSELPTMRQALTTARAFHLSAYDGVYLDTARGEGLPLATLDQSLRAAARRASVELLQL